MVMLMSVGVAMAAMLAFFASFSSRSFVPDACDRLRTSLEENLIGQPLAARVITQHVCAHLREKFPARPLVLSFHGPPGTGKSYSHLLTAQALYGLIGGEDSVSRSIAKSIHLWKQRSQNQVPIIKELGSMAEATVGNPLKCPGMACPAYKILFGMDYIRYDHEQQHHLLREAMLHHARSYSESIMVIEEYDKLHCETRAMVRQIVLHPEVANVSLGKSIIFLESNRGFKAVHQLLLESKQRDSVSEYEAHRRLKEYMLNFWPDKDCETEVENARFSNIIEFFVPYFPLDRSHIKQLIARSLEECKSSISKGQVTWTPEFIQYYLSQVHFDGAFALDGVTDRKLAMKKALELLDAAERSPEAEQCAEDSLYFALDIEKDRAVIRTHCTH